jgi:hypothetical protein
MRRLVVLLALLGIAVGAPAGAQAKAPCRDKIFNDWYHDGKVASTYPLSCYRDALRHIPPDVGVYSSLGDDIRLALQAAVNRAHGQKVPSQVGGSQLTSSSTTPSTTTKHKGGGTGTSTAPTSPDPGQMTTPTQTSTTAVQPTSGSSSGPPLPVLVLGGVALALVAAGGIGLGVRRFRRG